MAKRKTAFIVLSVIVLMSLFVLYLYNRKEQTLSFGMCSVDITDIGKGYEVDEYRAAKNKLALCLCKLYQNKADTAIANQITNIYRRYDAYNQRDRLVYDWNIDSLIKNKVSVFDTLVVVD